jgi:hypothetical protein
VVGDAGTVVAGAVLCGVGLAVDGGLRRTGLVERTPLT